MEQDIYLYPGSQSEAHRLGEAALWDASFHANVSCARDIEAVIRVYGDGRSALKPEASQMVLKRWGFKRTNFVLANTIERLGPYKEQLSAENQEWQKKAYVPPDDAHNRYFEVDTALAYLDAFISQVRCRFALFPLMLLMLLLLPGRMVAQTEYDKTVTLTHKPL